MRRCAGNKFRGGRRKRGELFAVLGCDFFGLDVESLADFVRNAWAKSAFASDLCGYLDLLAVGERAESRVRKSCRATQLHVKSPAGRELPAPRLRRTISAGRK